MTYLQPAIAAALSMLRAEAEARMLSRATIRRKTDQKTTDADGFEVPVWEDVYVDLPCWVDWESTGRAGVNVNVGAEVQVNRARRVIKAPHHATSARDNDVAKISGGACDGRFLQLTEVMFADQKKQQELPVIEIDEPEGWS